MAFEYSSFISYRREKERNKFIQSFCTHFNTTTFDVTNLQNHFLDSLEIKGSPDFEKKIYDAIKKSYFFSVFHTYHYLSEANLWCARELKYALDIEKCRREKLNKEDRDDFFYLNIFIVSGEVEDLPIEIERRNALSISKFPYLVGRPSKTLTEFFDDQYTFMLKIYKIYEKYSHIDFTELCDHIPIPTDEEIRKWVKVQKNRMKENESKHHPILTKKEE